MTGLGKWEMLSARTYTVTGLGKCGNGIGENLHGDWPWQNVEMLSASSFTVTGLGNCGNLIGDHLLGDWPWQMWKFYLRAPSL